MEIDINIYSRLKDIELMSRIEILELERKKKEIDEILNRLQKNSQTTRDKISELISDAVKTNSTKKMKE
ncbi:hypothetical protein [Bacteroides sp. 519]|uniref:hypothetical protein n=1 Tax=Bacteroides sp. 519 TaxID=2302937 RepID=UPI0013D61703|nr:hypothetical protein [Bacteroides sp. 519]